MRRVLMCVAAAVAALGSLDGGCGHDRSASLEATVEITGSDNSCASGWVVGQVCTITTTLAVSVQEVGGDDVHLETVSGVLWDRRAMTDLHASPASLAESEIRAAAGSSLVAAHGRLTIPYVLEFSVVQPSILGPIDARVRVSGRDSRGRAIEADCRTP
jgi:hypothetical protein